MGSWVDLVACLFILTGSVFICIGGIGLLRLRDVFERMHGASLIDTMGLGMIFLGLMLFSGFNLITAKLAIILGFVLITSPTATHALAQAALHSGVKPNVDDTSQKLLDKTLTSERENIGE